jgi:selenocysteine lyase/cysteine desulfurase
LSPEEIQAARNATPGCANVVHFNHAGASLMPRPVIDATVGHLLREAEIGGYEAADEAKERLESTYASTARLLDARPHEIALVENATRGWDMAFYAVPLAAGDRILTSASEYASNVIAFLQVAERGVSVEVVPNDEHGQVSVEALANMLDRRVKVVAISHMPTNGGLVQPAAAIGRVLRGSDAIYILDACQTAGQLPLDVDEFNCDVLSGTSRKYLRGPRGVGFLYVREALIERLVPPLLDLHAASWTAVNRFQIRQDARRFENWESYVAGRLGMGAAIEYALTLGLDRIWATLHAHAAELRTRLAALSGVQVHDLGVTKGGIVTFSHAVRPAEAIVEALRKQRINTVTSSIFSTRFDMERRGLRKIVRASVHYLTTSDEIDQFIAALEGAI